MNAGVIVIGIVMIFAACLGILAMAQANSAPPVDSFGNTLSASSNATHGMAVNMSSDVAAGGGITGIAIAVVFVAGMLLGVVFLIQRGGGKYSSINSRR